LQPEDTVEKQIAKQLGLTPINPYAKPPETSEQPVPKAQTIPPANLPSTSPMANRAGNK